MKLKDKTESLRGIFMNKFIKISHVWRKQYVVISSTVTCTCRGDFDEIALFTVNYTHLHYNEIQHVCEAISGYFVVLARNWLASTLDNILMQMRKINREKGYYS